MEDPAKMAGVKAYLRRTQTTQQLQDLAAQAFISASDEVTITSFNSEGAGTSGVIAFPKWLLLQAIEEVLAEGNFPRQLATSVDRSRYITAL
jgi:hypothetical protein